MFAYMQKINLILFSLLTYNTIKDLAIWLAKSILPHNLRNRTLPDEEFAGKYT